MTETLIILATWAVFSITHIGMSADSVRPRLVAAIGALPFQGVYTMISFATMVPIFWVYMSGGRHMGPLLYDPPNFLKLAAVVIMGLAMLLLVGGLATPAPSSMINRGEPRALGVLRVTRHPVSAAFFLIGLAHLLVAGYATDVAFFGCFCVFSFVATRHQDARKVAGVRGYTSFRDATSFLPFAAILAGKQPLGAAMREWPWPAFAASAAAFVTLYMFHGYLFGVGLVGL